MDSRCKLVCLLTSILMTSPFAIAQNSAVSLSSSQSVVTDPNHFIGLDGAVAGFFHHTRKLDFLYGGQDHSRSTPNEFWYLATNNGNGTFTRTAATPCDYVPNFSTDLDGDGIWDIWCSSSSTVQYGDGNGGFSAPYHYPSGSTADVLDAVAADFNGDGRPDLALITVGRQLQILLNQGSRVFTLVHTYPLPAVSGTPAVKLVAEDLNGDHKFDLVVIYGGSNSSVTPYTATSAGAFTQGSTTSIGAFVPAIISAAGRDVNRDGYGDIALITGSGVKFMFGTPAGAFVAGPAIASAGAGCFAGASGAWKGLSCLVLADLSGDGNVDLAIAGTTRGTSFNPQSYVRVYTGNGQGQFSAATQYSIPSFPKVLIAGDVNGTGRLDLTVATEAQIGITILRNIGNGRFASAVTTPAPNAQGLVAADFNRDGKPDIAVVNTPTCAAPCNGSVTHAYGSGSTWFNTPSRQTIGMHGAAIATGDLNHDGFLDLVVTNATPGDNADLSVLMGNASGSFQPAANHTLGSLSQDAFLADVNKDGKLDLIEDGGVALGKGDGTFGPLTAFPAGLAFGATNRFTVADFNGDGNPDVAFAAPDSTGNYGTIQILLGNGAGGWSVGQNIFSSQPISYITAGTIRPGKPIELVYSYNGINGIGNGYQDNTGVLNVPGNGDGTFDDTVGGAHITGGDYAYQFFGPVAIGDFNGDGKPDVGVTDPYDGEFAVAPGNGDDTFGPVAIYSADNNATGIATADFDGNKLTDVILSSNDGLTRLYGLPVPTVLPGQLNFSGAAGGTQTVSIKNTLPSAVSIGAAIPVDPSPFAIQSSTCGTSLAPGSTCTITVVIETVNGLVSHGDLIIAANGAQIEDVPLSYFP
jgi:hypothetical protein